MDPDTVILKLCDWKCKAAGLRRTQCFICSWYYRAPESIFGATDLTSSIDAWSVGFVLAELLLGQPIFPGHRDVDQLVEIIKIKLMEI